MYDDGLAPVRDFWIGFSISIAIGVGLVALAWSFVAVARVLVSVLS